MKTLQTQIDEILLSHILSFGKEKPDVKQQRNEILQAVLTALPEKITYGKGFTGYGEGWNACLDTIKERLENL